MLDQEILSIFINYLADQMQLSVYGMLTLFMTAFLAGIVRGFTGFGLSALIMAVAVLPPIQVIPILTLLELASGVAMFRGGLRDARMSMVFGLAIASILAVPIGLFITVYVSVWLSSLLALSTILLLVALLFLKVKFTFLATKSGEYTSGAVAGIVSGVAGIGGMVIAFYVLANSFQPKMMRASLAMYLLITSLVFLIYLYLFGMLDETVFWRFIFLAPMVVIGVFCGSWLFRPKFIKYYRSLCLILLFSMAAFSLYKELFV